MFLKWHVRFFSFLNFVVHRLILVDLIHDERRIRKVYQLRLLMSKMSLIFRKFHKELEGHHLVLVFNHSHLLSR